MRGKMFGICMIIVLLCSGSSYNGILQPHYTLSVTSVELGMEDTFDPYAYVLKNTQPISEEDKEFLVIDGTFPTKEPGEYELTYNQYMKLHVLVKDTMAPVIAVDSFSWGIGVPFVWNEEALKRVAVQDNYTAEENLRKTIQCEDVDTAYLGDREVSCTVKDEAGNIGRAKFMVSVEKKSTQSFASYKDLDALPYTTLQKEEIVQLLAFVNQERIAANLSPISLGDAQLMNITMKRAKEVQQLYSHDRPNGEVCFTILSENNYSYESAGENVAKGQQSALEVIQDWMASDTHRKIILTPEFKKLGISVMGEGADKVWTLIFIE